MSNYIKYFDAVRDAAKPVSQPSEPTRAEQLHCLAGQLEAENEVIRLQSRLAAVTAERDRLRNLVVESMNKWGMVQHIGEHRNLLDVPVATRLAKENCDYFRAELDRAAPTTEPGT